MIYITGDTHIPHDINKLMTENFPEQKSLTKNDFVIICGDFGGVWKEGAALDRYWQDLLNDRNYTTLFIDGNHENFDLLNKYPVTMWNGGKVHYIKDSVIHLMRGQVYAIDGLKFFTMGGGESTDKEFRVKGRTWWAEELPSDTEYDEALANLEKHKWKVDYLLTHTCSMRIMKDELCYIKENNELNKFFDMLEKDLKYKHWYFGHFHEDRNIDSKHTAVFNKINKLP